MARTTTLPTSLRALAALALCLLCASVLPASVRAQVPAQVVEVRGRGDAENDAFLRRLVASGAFELVARDTLVGRADTIHSTAFVVGTTMRLEGVITGDLVIVDANVFVRPTAQVLGSIRNISGGLFYSELAAVSGGIRSDPNAPYRVEHQDDGRVVILGTMRESVIVLYGFMGLLAPTYDRVDGVTISANAGYLLPRAGSLEPIVRGRVDYRSQRGAITGGAELAVTRRRTEVALGAERTTLTNERWIRGDLTNTAAALFLGRDVRDYYAADRAYYEVRRLLEEGSHATTAFLRAQVEDASGLRAGNPWSLFGNFREDNIVVTDSRTTSALAGINTTSTMRQHVIDFAGVAESAFELLDSDHTFNRYEVTATWAMAALANHTLTISGHARGPLPGTDSLPPQRWSFVGGSGTLPTFAIAEFRGDRVVFVETEYSIPLPRRFRFRLLGQPHLDFLHLAGTAWSAGESRELEQNVGVRLRYNIVYVRAVTNPRRFEDEVDFTVGVAFPRRSLPWQLGR